MEIAIYMDKSRKRKLLLFAADPNCHWCRRPVRMPPETGGKNEPDHATIDHLFTRWNPFRWVMDAEGERTVLACYKCNQERSKEYEELTEEGKEFARRILESLPPANRPHPRVARKFYRGTEFRYEWSNPHK